MAEASFTVKVSVEPSEPTVERSTTVLKADKAQRFLLMVAYPAMKADHGIAADGFRDFASAPAVEAACWNFMRKGAKLGLNHQPGNDDIAETVESYIWRGPDWVTTAANGHEQVIKAGDWMLGVVCSEKGWQMYEAGLISGASPQGRARRRMPTAETLAQLRS